MSRENDLSQIEADRNLTEQQITTERGPDEIIAYPSQGVFVVPPEKWGPMKFPMGLSGSLTNLSDGSPYLIAGNNITITTGSKGQITISAVGKIGGTSGGSGGGTVATSVEWKSYTPTITLNSGTPPTIDPQPFCYLKGLYVVQGKMMTLLFSMSGTGIGSYRGDLAGGPYLISLPPGFFVDLNLVALTTLGGVGGTSLGVASIIMNNSDAGTAFSVLPYDSTKLMLHGQYLYNTNSLQWSAAALPFNTIGTTYRISFVANIPLS